MTCVGGGENPTQCLSEHPVLYTPLAHRPLLQATPNSANSTPIRATLCTCAVIPKVRGTSFYCQTALQKHKPTPSLSAESSHTL